MSAWLSGAPLIGLATLLPVVPGLLIAGVLRLSPGLSLAFSPVLGLGALGAWTFIWGGLALPWGWGAVAVLSVLLVGLFGVVQWRRAVSEDLVPSALSSQSVVVIVFGVAGVVAYAAIQFWSIGQVLGSPEGLPHLGDADFHLQGAQLVAETGRVFPVGGLGEIYSPGSGSSAYYPTLWHALVALLMPFDNLVVATNSMVLAFSLFFWPAGIAVLGAALLPRNPYVVFLAPLLAVTSAMFPATAGIAFSVLPFALSMVTFPAGVGALLLWQRSLKLRYGAVYGFALLAGVAAQPAVALLTLSAGGVAVVVVYFRWAASLWAHGSRFLAAALIVGAVAAAGSVAMVFRHNAYLKALASFPRGPMTDQPVKAYFDGMVSAVSEPWLPWIGILVFAGVGLVLQLRTPVGWIYLGVTVIGVTAFIASAGPDSTLRALTGPWYKDPLRLGSVAAVLTTTAAASGLASVIQSLAPKRLTPRAASVWAALAALLAVAGWICVDPRIAQVGREHMSNGYRIDNRDITPVRADSIPLFERLDDHFEPGERLLSTHGSGGGFIVAYSEMRPFNTMRSFRTDEQKYLAEHFGEINEDPHVCEIIREYDITAFMADMGRPGYVIWGDLGGPPTLDVSEGFELVDQEGEIRVWRITACD